MKELENLDIEKLQKRAKIFVEELMPSQLFPEWYPGPPDRGAVQDQVRKRFHLYLSRFHSYRRGNGRDEIEFPDLNVDIYVIHHYHRDGLFKFRNAKQVLCGPGCHILVMGYQTRKNNRKKTVSINFPLSFWMEREQNNYVGIPESLYTELKNAASREEVLDLVIKSGLLSDRESLESCVDEILKDRFFFERVLSFSPRGWKINYASICSGLSRAGLTGIWDIGYVSTAGLER